jgi:uncharacterized protein with GYD domain
MISRLVSSLVRVEQLEEYVKQGSIIGNTTVFLLINYPLKIEVMKSESFKKLEAVESIFKTMGFDFSKVTLTVAFGVYDAVNTILKNVTDEHQPEN